MGMTSTLKDFLHAQRLRYTSCRHDVLQLFAQSSYALSAKDLEQNLPQYDRVTLYRNLHTYIEKGIIHLIPHDGGLAFFGLSERARQQLVPSATTSAQRYHDHIHFTCTACGRTECLPDHMVPEVVLPPAYQVDEVDMLVKGQCQACRL